MIAFFSFLCWPIVYDAGPTSAQHWANASCLLGLLNRSVAHQIWGAQLYECYDYRLCKLTDSGKLTEHSLLLRNTCFLDQLMIPISRTLHSANTRHWASAALMMGHPPPTLSQCLEFADQHRVCDNAEVI